MTTTSLDNQPGQAPHNDVWIRFALLGGIGISVVLWIAFLGWVAGWALDLW